MSNAAQSFEALLAKADPEQRAAIEHPLDGGPAILVAAAGSGKTFTLTARVKWLIQQGVTAWRIVAITFTNKAANEIRERLGVEEGAENCPRVSTIHSLALSAIRKDTAGFGLGPKVSPLDTGDQADMIDSLVSAKFKGAKKDSAWAEFNVWQFLEKVGFHRARGLGFAADYTPEVHARAEKYLKGYFALSKAEVELWKEYEETKKKASCLDFDDMVHLVVARAKTDPTWAARLGRQFHHVLVDESQDTSPIQWAFIEVLVGETGALDMFAVGDASQSIMGFQGARPDILVKMTKGWKGVDPKLYVMDRNYRSVPEVIKLANNIQSHMTETIPLTMRAQKPSLGPCVGKLSGPNAAEIGIEIGAKIAADNRKGEFKYKENAILVRGKSQIKDVEMGLIRARVPYVIRGGSSLLQSAEAKDLIAYLRLISNPNDLSAFTRAVSVPKRGVGDAGIRALQVQADKGHNGNLILAAIASPNSKLNEFGNLLRMFQVAIERSDNRPTVGQIMEAVVEHISYKALLRARAVQQNMEPAEKMEMLDKIMESITSIEEALGSNGTLEDIVFRLAMDRDSDEKDTNGKVVISTIHASKGLEWERVFVTNLVEGSLPHRWSVSDAEIEEERRLAYVAITRARRRLYLCVPQTTQIGKNTAAVKPSRFLSEMLRAKEA